MSQASDSPFAPRRRPTRVAIVGAGFIADFHLEILKETEGVEVAAICDPAAHARNACGDKWGVATRVASVAELKDLDIDVAHVLVPPDLHDRLVREILDLGIGAFVEKPLVLDSKQARELQALADSKGLPLGVNHNNRFHPAFEKLVERVESGEIGRVEHVRVCLSVPLMQLDAQQFSHWMFQAPRNIIFEQAPHPLCQVHRLIGQVKNCQTKILGTRELLPGQVFHDRWLAAAEGEHGTAEIYFAFGQGFTRSTIEVIGSDGSLEADLFHNHCVGERKTLWLDAWNSYLAGRGRAKGYTKDARRVFFHYGKYTLKLGRREDAFFVGMRRSMQAFHEAYSAGQALPVDGAQAAEVLDWCEAVAEGVSGESAPRKPWPDVIDARPGEVAVTGGTGFIGKRVIEQLLERKVPVTLIARRNHSFPPEVNAGVQDGRIRLVRASLEDTEGMTKAFEGVDSVISLATGGAPIGRPWSAR